LSRLSSSHLGREARRHRLTQYDLQSRKRALVVAENLGQFACLTVSVFGEDDHLRRRANQVGEQVDETEAQEEERESYLSAGRTAGLTLVVTRLLRLPNEDELGRLSVTVKPKIPKWLPTRQAS